MDRAVVRLHAVLQGIGRKGTCVLETWKERSSKGRVFTRAVIVEERPKLPDGLYILVLCHGSIFVRKLEGAWRLTFLPPEISLEGDTELGETDTALVA